jgi:tetratricopeptide (TPR) repeat protein
MATEPQDLDADELLALAKHEVQRGELESALLKLKRLVSQKKPPAAAVAAIARVYAQLGLTDSAQKHFRKYLELNPDAAHETFELGVTYFDQGNDAGALDYWKRALELQPAHPPALFFSAVAHSRMGNVAEARRGIDVLLKTAPSDNLYVERGRELLKSLDGQPLAQGLSVPSGSTPYGGH